MQDSTRFEIRIAGFGGQGVVTIGKVLGHAFSIHEGVNSVNTRSMCFLDSSWDSFEMRFISSLPCDFDNTLNMEIMP